jgi:hypothetical protein
MDLKVYDASSADVAEIAKKLPLGRLYANGRGFVPNVRQALYSDVVVTLAGEPQEAALGKDDTASLPVARISPLRVVGGHRHWPQGGHVHSAVPRLPEAAQVCSSPQRHRTDEPSQRAGLAL